MRKWRYKVENIKISIWTTEKDRAPLIEERLVRLGMEGWELVNTVSSSGSYNVFLYLKRPY